MSKKLTRNKIHRGAPDPDTGKSEVAVAVEDLASSAKSKLTKNLPKLVGLVVLIIVAVLGFQIFELIKADQEDELQGNLYRLTSSPPTAGQEGDRISELDALLTQVRGQPQERTFYLEIVSTLLEQADPAVAASANPFSITATTGGAGEEDDTGKQKLLEAAGRLAMDANDKFGEGLNEWNKQIQAIVSEKSDTTWLHKPRSYRLLSPKAEASSK